MQTFNLEGSCKGVQQKSQFIYLKVEWNVNNISYIGIKLRKNDKRLFVILDDNNLFQMYIFCEDKFILCLA